MKARHVPAEIKYITRANSASAPAGLPGEILGRALAQEFGLLDPGELYKTLRRAGIPTRREGRWVFLPEAAAREFLSTRPYLEEELVKMSFRIQRSVYEELRQHKSYNDLVRRALGAFFKKRRRLPPHRRTRRPGDPTSFTQGAPTP